MKYIKGNIFFVAITSSISAGVGYIAAGQINRFIGLKAMMILTFAGICVSVAPLNFINPESTDLVWLVYVCINGYKFFNSAGFTMIYVVNG